MTESRFDENHCSRWSGIKQDRLTDFHRACIGIIVSAFRTGPWNISTKWERMVANDYGGKYSYFKINVRCGGLATFDFDPLTRLVIGAHEECIRVCVSPCTPQMLSIEMWPRKGREGSMSERHPIIEDAVADYRNRTK